MPSFATLNLKNQAGTETAFQPTTIDPSSKVATWLGAGASLDSKTQVSISTLLPTGRATRVRTKGKVVIPIIDSVTGLKIDEIICNVDFSIPKNSALSSRQDARAYMADFLTDTVIVNAVENFESVY